MKNLQRVITIGCIVIGILVLVGTVSAFFSPAIQAALTLPTRKTTPTAGSMNGGMPAAHSTQPSMKVTMTVPSPTTAPTKLLARDTYQRNDQRFWGMASVGLPWEGFAISA